MTCNCYCIEEKGKETYINIFYEHGVNCFVENIVIKHINIIVLLNDAVHHANCTLNAVFYTALATTIFLMIYVIYLISNKND